MSILEPMRERSSTLPDLIDRILDKGLVINADITVSVAGVELLGIKVRATIASFETAAKYGLEFPSGSNYQAKIWQDAQISKETCPQCGKKSPSEQLLHIGCSWCGWQSALARGEKSLMGKAAIYQD